MDIPHRTATDRYLAENGIQLRCSFDVDLGELIPGHRVIARGIGLAPSVPLSLTESSALPTEVVEKVKRSNQPPRDQFHFEHVPGLSRGHVTPDWGFEANDDVGTLYRKDDQGAFDGHSGGLATHAVREPGGKIPPEARTLTLRIIPGYDGTGHQWHPREPWRRELTIDLITGRAAD